MPELQTSLSWR